MPYLEVGEIKDVNFPVFIIELIGSNYVLTYSTIPVGAILVSSTVPVDIVLFLYDDSVDVLPCSFSGLNSPSSALVV